MHLARGQAADFGLWISGFDVQQGLRMISRQNPDDLWNYGFRPAVPPDGESRSVAGRGLVSRPLNA